MNQISLEWLHYPDGSISAVGAHGLTSGQLQAYAEQSGFQTVEGVPALVGTTENRNALLCLLEMASYEVDAEEIVMPEVAR